MITIVFSLFSVFSTQKPDATQQIRSKRGKLTRQKLSYDVEATDIQPVKSTSYAEAVSVMPIFTLQSPTETTEDEGTSDIRCILDGISAFFNPGDLVGIMGPSGCGKTTLLDLLTGRRRAGSIKVHMNGKMTLRLS